MSLRRNIYLQTSLLHLAVKNNEPAWGAKWFEVSKTLTESKNGDILEKYRPNIIDIL